MATGSFANLTPGGRPMFGMPRQEREPEIERRRMDAAREVERRRIDAARPRGFDSPPFDISLFPSERDPVMMALKGITQSDMLLGTKPYTENFRFLTDLLNFKQDPDSYAAGYVYGLERDRDVYLLHHPWGSGAERHGVTEEEYAKGMREWTAPHEIGHLAAEVQGLDKREWEAALDEYMIGLENPLDARLAGIEQPWDFAVQEMRKFPGVGSNPKQPLYDDKGNVLREWGGHWEAYADMFYWSGGSLERVPPPLRKYFDMWLGPETDRRRVADDHPSNTSYLHRANNEVNNNLWADIMKNFIVDAWPGKEVEEVFEDGTVQFTDGETVQIPEEAQMIALRAAKDAWMRSHTPPPGPGNPVDPGLRDNG